ncbi:MAG: type VI secretion protein IcmF/TssM N-terminal domain-containing protein [Sedimentisphaerales bacterium]|nr:type VI secretion protein IcmF/TssM N-terminal domain-containing protein [Sedimentisphaerales bacterium]
MPLKIGLMVVTGGGIMTAIWYVLSPKLLWILFIGIAIIVLLLLLYRYLLKLYKKRKSAPMERGVISSATAAPQGISEAAHMARVDDLRKKFEDGIDKFRAAGKNLYDFPWYMIVGEPGSGKTEAIRHCNIGFPPGLQDQFQGAGGTLNMNWWFTDHAVILDTAGRLMFEEVEAGGSSEWREFLTLLKKSRPRCPVNGVFLVIPADSLIKDTADEIEQKASKIAKQFDIIQRSLDVRFPVFVVITKSDLINGFRDFFDKLEDPQLQHQIMGWSNPAPLDEPYNPSFIDQQLKTIQARLFRRRLALLQDVISSSDESGTGKKQESDTLYAFPQSLSKIAPRMARYLELVFSVGSQWSCKPLFFRGIYFTSSMREGSALDEDLADSLGVPVDSLPDGRVWERDRAYFLRDLFIKKVFREKGLVTHATNAKKLHMRRKALVLFTAAASVILLLFFTIYTAISFNKDIGDMTGYLETSAKMIESGKIDGLQVLMSEGEGSYRFIGPAGMPGENIKRMNFSGQLADSVSRWKIPRIFAPAAKFLKNIEPESLSQAQGIVYEESVLRPFLDAAGEIMGTQENGNWTLTDVETSTLHQLIQIKAEKSLNNDGEYSAETFLDPLFRYVFQHDPNQIQRYNNDKTELHRPLEMIYAQINNGSQSKSEAMGLRDWPPVSLTTDPNSKFLEAAIANGIKLFNEYWRDPGRLGIQNRDYAQVQTISNLKNALEKFDAAEIQILGLGSSFDLKSDNLYTVQQFNKFASDWNESYQNLKEAKENIDNDVNTLNNPQSLVILWNEQAKRLLQDVNKNYKFLLDELKDVNDVEYPFLGNMRRELENALGGIADTLSKSDFAQKLDKFDVELYARVPRDQKKRRLYAIRYEMYSQANEQLLQTMSISNIVNEVAETIEEVENTFTRSTGIINELNNLDPNPAISRFREASKISTLALNLAEQRQLYQIVKSSLNITPKSIENIEKLIEKEGKWDWANILTTIIDKRYDPYAAAAMLGAWKSFGEKIGKDLSLEKDLQTQYAAEDKTYATYREQFLHYWFSTVPERVIVDKAKHDSEQYQSVVASEVYEELRLGLVVPLETVLNELGKYDILIGNNEIKQFEDSLIKYKQNKDDTIQTFRREFDNWTELRGNPETKRRTLLSMRPAAFRDSYAPFSYQSRAQFVDMYLVKLTCSMLHQLTSQVQSEKTEALNELRKHSNKFPLDPDSKDDLTEAAFTKVRLLFDKTHSQRSFPEGTIGSGEKTRIDEVDTELEELQEPLVEAQKKLVELEQIEQIFRGLPASGNLCYCRIKLLSEKTQRSLLQQGEETLSDYLTELRFVQGSQRSERFNTRTREDLNVCVVKYPGPQLDIEFYQYPSSTEPSKVLTFPESWACLRMLKLSFDSQKKGHIRLNVDSKDDNLGGTLYLQLEFFNDNNFKQPVESNFIEAMTDFGTLNSDNR